MTEPNDALRFGQEGARDADLDQLLHPSWVYGRPDDVVADERLTIQERRAILASWASDACAVESNPPLRRPAFAPSAVTFDEIMDALQHLDGMTRPGGANLKPRWRSRSSALRTHQPHLAGLSEAV